VLVPAKLEHPLFDLVLSGPGELPFGDTQIEECPVGALREGAEIARGEDEVGGREVHGDPPLEYRAREGPESVTRLRADIACQTHG
jgi:hypothetical protein